MNEQKGRFVNFMLDYWIDYNKFTGASMICAMFLNFFFLIFKLVACAIILVVCAPHLVANNLLNKQEKSIVQKMLYILMVLISLCIDVPLLILCVAVFAVLYDYIVAGDFRGVILSILLIFILVRILVPLLVSLFVKSDNVATESEDIDVYEQEGIINNNALIEDSQIGYHESFKEDNIDKMSGIEFERFCAELLVKCGYSNVRLTVCSGDQGIDVLAEKDDLKWGFQCKRWGIENHIGNDVIQKTFAGKAFYHCDIAVVITTTTFTRKAEEYAKETGIILWGRDKLYDMMEKVNYID